MLAGLSVVLAGVLGYQKLVQIEVNLSVVNKTFSCSNKIDCVLAYTGTSACAPCDNADESMKCVSSAEVERLQQERVKKHGSVFCAMCPTPFQLFTCICQNGSCAKVAEEETASWNMLKAYDGVLGIKYPLSRCTANDSPRNSDSEFDISINCGSSQVYIKTVPLDKDLNWEKAINSSDPIYPSLKVMTSQYTTLAGEKALRQVYQSIDKNHEFKGVYIYIQAPEGFAKDLEDRVLIKFVYDTRISGLPTNSADIALIEKILSTFRFIK